ncbi:TPA: glycosyltransferase family 2 protein [Candidatus Woesearchaeota archaeon]|nr:glycosyl transferase [archaeon]HIJ11390.1 glycosyltransferase family 2 protein [Candidatus Woesearchaeota archaeon]
MQKLSVIIPCYNEEDSISQLHDLLIPEIQVLQSQYEIELIFVDDGSKDATNKLLQQRFGSYEFVKIVTHLKNTNLGGALRTGIKNSTGHLIAMLDSDCSYHPQILHRLLATLDEKTDIVGASGLHPQGNIEGVSEYRKMLSRTVAGGYKILLSHKIHSPTSMIRVYRRKVLENVTFHSNDFMAVTELLAKSLLQGYKFKEIPAINRRRNFGTSKLNVRKETKNHLILWKRIAAYRFFKRKF